MKSTINEVFSAVHDERVYQDRKWGNPDQHPHEVGGYITLMRKLLNDAEVAWCTSRGDDGALDELRKVVAVGVACMEQHGVAPRKPVDFAALQPDQFTAVRAEDAKSARPTECPHGGSFVYCEVCPVSVCPMGLGLGVQKGC